ncbi:MAG: M23 family metallopeptidase, partial [Bdellovibrionales bacterium]
VSPSEVSQLNNLQAPYRLQSGQVLRLPNASGASGASGGQATALPAEPVKVTEAVKVEPVAKEAIIPARKPEGAAKASERPPEKTIIKRVAETPKRAGSKFLRPVNGRVLSSYGPKSDGLHNDGINIAAPRGTAVQAAENGVVVYAGNGLKASGNLILLRHDDRWMSAYAHLDQIKVKNGQNVRRGSVIGSVGSSGAVHTPQLHFELRRGTQALNPQPYLE